VPSRPDLHRREDFYLQDGALIAHCAPFTNPRGLRCPGFVKVLTRDRRYELGHALVLDELGVRHGCVWADARRDRQHGLQSLDELIRACREVFGPNSRYDIDPLEDP
jgi:hypothetical protein